MEALALPFAVLLWLIVAAVAVSITGVLVFVGVGLFRSIQRHRTPRINPPLPENRVNEHE